METWPKQLDLLQLTQQPPLSDAGGLAPEVDGLFGPRVTGTVRMRPCLPRRSTITHRRVALDVLPRKGYSFSARRSRQPTRRARIARPLTLQRAGIRAVDQPSSASSLPWCPAVWTPATAG